MHVHHADRHVPQTGWGCGRHADAGAHVALRHRSRLDVDASAATQPAAVNLDSTDAAAARVREGAAAGNATYDLAAMRRQKGSVSILTQDGDTVRIRFQTRAGVAVQSSTETTSEGTTTSTSVHAFAAGRVRVEVNGELDAEELKAIGSLMEKVDALAAQFFGGDTEAAFSAAAELGFDAGEIAGFALRLSVKEYSQVRSQAPAVAAPAATPEPPASVPEPAPVTEPGTGAESAAAQPAPASTAATPTEATATEPPATPVATDAAPATAPESLPPPVADPMARLQQTLGGFLKQVLDGLAGSPGAGRAEFTMRWKIQAVIAAVQSSPAAATSDPAGMRLATESLEGLASSRT
jgi:hypothetical protein